MYVESLELLWLLHCLQAMERAKVLDFELQKQLVPYMKDIVPLPGAPAWPLSSSRQQLAAGTSCIYLCSYRGVM
jgi:hypothetical protein